MAEGPHLLEELLRSPWNPEEVLCTPLAQSRFSELLARVDAPVTTVAERAFASIATTEATQGILALTRPRKWTWEDVTGRDALVVILDTIQDPGNVGTIARSAEAFGASGIILASGCARVSNGKVLRAAAGSFFRTPYIEAAAPQQILGHLSLTNLKVYGLAANGTMPISQADFKCASAVLVGNEGAGLNSNSWPGANLLSIPTTGVES
ncbi:MAG: RNA methyltransferase, partial [Acidobacteriota bacterium]|nr:RNA methyltransferase [Acidobacteriota bacterium]